MNLKTKNYAWYAVYTRANQEKKILRDLTDENIECFLPLKKSLKQWSDRKKWVEEPLFRCYIFVRISYVEFYDVLITPGVVCYVSFGGRPQTIPDIQIENLKTMIKQNEMEVTLTHNKLAKGVKAEVIFGALKGMQGEIVQIYGQSRILIRVESLGCCLYANISNDEIKLIQPKVEKEKKIRYIQPDHQKVSVI